MTAAADPRRRTVVGLAGAGVVCPLLAACGAGGSDRATAPGSASASSPSPSPSQSQSPAPSPEETETPEQEPSKEPQAMALVAASEVPVGGGKVLADERVVVTQPSGGQFRAFTAVCTHEGCVVASVNDGLITCYCHGSQFAITDGTVERGPAQRPLAEIKVEVVDGRVRRA